MVLARRVSTTLSGAYVWLWVGGFAVSHLGLSDAPGIALVVVLSAVVLAVAWRASRRVEPWTVEEAEDVVVLWGMLITGGVMLGVVSLGTGSWRLYGAAAVAVAGFQVFAVVRRVVARRQARFLARAQYRTGVGSTP